MRNFKHNTTLHTTSSNTKYGTLRTWWNLSGNCNIFSPTEGILVLSAIRNYHFQVVFPTKTNISIGHSYFVYQTSGKPNVTWKGDKDKLYTLYLSGKIIFLRLSSIQSRMESNGVIFLGATHKEIIYPDRALIQADNFLQFPNTRWVQWLICNIHGSNLSTGIELIPHSNFSEPENPAGNIFHNLVTKYLFEFSYLLNDNSFIILFVKLQLGKFIFISYWNKSMKYT